MKQRFVTGTAGSDPNFWKPLTIYLRRGDNGGYGYTAFDNVKLDAKAATVDNPGFEIDRIRPAWSTEGFNIAPTGWTAENSGLYKAIVNASSGDPLGIPSPTDGDNVFVACSGTVRSGIDQIAKATLQPNTQYTLSVDVYAGDWDTQGQYAGNEIKLTAGNATYLDSYNPMWTYGYTQIGNLINGTPAGYYMWNLGYDTTLAKWYTVKQRFATGAAGSDSNFGQPMTIYVRRGNNDGAGFTAFDNVKLYIDSVYNNGVGDNTSPVGSISINSGAAHCSSTSVTLTLSTSDSESGVAQMRFSNNNSTWGSWTPYGTSNSWTLSSGSGTKTVYAQFKDYAGNVSSTALDTIILD